MHRVGSRLLGGLALLRPHSNSLRPTRSILFKMGNETPSRVVGYYVLFPVIPDENVENNPFVYNIAKNEDWPRLTSVTPQQMYEGTVRMLMEYGATTMEHLEHLEKTPDEPRTFESVVEPLLNEEYEVNYAFQTLLLKMLTDWPECNRKLFDADLHHIKIMCARDHMEKLSSPVFQKAIAELYEKKEGLNEWQLRLLEWYLLEVKATGWDKKDDKTRKVIGSWNRFIDEYRSKYITNVMATNDQNTWSMISPTALKDAPPHVLQGLALDPHYRTKWSTGPWRAKMTPHSIFPFLTYCEDRSMRAAAWDKWTSKAGFNHDFYNNSVNIEELRHNNEGLAKILGYGSVAEHRLANKMAASPDTVRNFLNALVRRVRPVFIDRTEAWSAYAQKELLTGELAPHDLFLVCRKEAEAHYDVKPLDLMNHFPFWPTFDNLCSLVSHIFNLKFKDVTSSVGEKCHADVRVLSVEDLSTGEHLGRLYIDPFDREGKRGGWNALLGRTASTERGLDKLVYLVGNGCCGGPSLLHHSQLQQLLFHFGRSLQLLLSRSPYRDIAIPWSPFYASDWDAADIFPAFLQFFIYKPNLLQSLSSPHLVSGASLNEDQANAVSLALCRSTLWESYRTLFWSDFDLSIYEMDRKDKFWLDLYKDLYAEYFPWKFPKNDSHPCSFTPIFAIQPNMGMHYRKLWTEMLALDVHETFDQENDEKKTGERLKSTLLSRGSGDVAKELYRRFQGRDPSVGAICDFYDPPSFFHIEERTRRQTQ